MNIIDPIMDWWNRRRAASAEPPTFVPLTRAEIREIRSEAFESANAAFLEERQSANRVLGMEIFNTPYAEEMRIRQVELEQVPFVTEFDVSELALAISDKVWRDETTQFQHHRLQTLICADTTELKVVFEWDTLAWLKRALRLTRWWPVRTRKVAIEGRVLYPYLKVSLPQNRHHVKLLLKP